MMERLFSPWRSQYIQSFSKPGKADSACVLCSAYQEKKDDENLIVRRGTHCYVILNRYPYNSGHLMIVPYRHLASPVDLNALESGEIMGLLQQMINALQSQLHPDGFNIGANVGRSAGAGIDQHIHFHLVPRWNGDTNFMPTLADTKIVSEDMRETLKKLRGVM